MILYRFISIISAIVINWNGNLCEMIFDIFLSIIDMYIIKTVYESIKDGADEPSPRQKMYQLAESAFESLPQVIYIQNYYYIYISYHSIYIY